MNRSRPSDPVLGRLLAVVLIAAGGGAAPVAQTPFNRSLLRPDPAAAERAGGEFAAAIDRARGAVVHVYVEVAGRNAFKLERPSSGVLVGDDGLVLTHWSLVREASGATDKALWVQLADANATRMEARIVAHDEHTGLALLHVEVPADANLVGLPIAAGVEWGDPVAVLAYGDGEDATGFAGVAVPALGDIAVGDGGVEPLRRDEVLLTDAPIQARSHGGALLDRAGALVGICSADRVRPEVQEPTLDELKQPSFGFVIPTSTIARAFGAAWPAARAARQSRSTGAAAVEAIAAAVVTVRGSPGAIETIGNSDPYATRRRAGVGSGVVIDARGIVLTNRHLVDGADRVRVTLGDGSLVDAKVLGSDRPTNTALLELALPAGRSVPFAMLGDPSAVAVGDPLLAVGRPEPVAPTVCAGVLSARRDGRLQTDLSTGNQNGGGALVNARGELLGIVDAGVRDKIDVAFAHRGDQAKVESSLNLVPGIDVVLAAHEVVLTRLGIVPPAFERTPPAPGPIARVVERIGDSMLNIYVEITTAQAELDDNPFAEPKPRTTVESLGSGVIVDPSGLALTNWHVVDAATEPDGSMRGDRVVRAALRDGTTFAVRVLSISREEDLALVQLELEPGRTVRAVELGSSSALQVGDTAIAIGNPHGRANTVTVGVITAKNQAIRVRGRWAKLPNLLETDAAINAGNSGGALLDAAGRLIGINSAGGSLHSVTGFAIAVDHVRDTLHRVLLSPEKLRSPYFGIALGDRDDAAFVASVDPNGPAATAGVQSGDLLRSIDGVAVDSSVRATLRALGAVPGERCRLGLERAGVPTAIDVMPLSAAAWAVCRQIGCTVREFPLREDPSIVQNASIAFVRAFTGDPTAAPTLIPSSLVCIVEVLPRVRSAGVDLAPGDLLLGVELGEELAGADAGKLVRFESIADVQRCINENGTYEGSTFRAWVQRDGVVNRIALPAKRLML